MRRKIFAAVFPTVAFAVAVSLAYYDVASAQAASASVEGNCVVAQTAATPGTCGDYDGDGRLGAAEDADGDAIYGTLSAALVANGTNPRRNVTITVVTSGTFAEAVTITDAYGNVTLQAAPGVVASLDAQPQGDDNSTLRSQNGITVNSARFVTIRNLTIRNWSGGVAARGNAEVVIENCRFENNATSGVYAEGDAKVLLTHSAVLATGVRNFEQDSNPPVLPAPAFGVYFNGKASGLIFSTTVSGTSGAGVANNTGRPNAVCAYLVNSFNNSPNFDRIIPSLIPCGSADVKGRTFVR